MSAALDLIAFSDEELERIAGGGGQQPAGGDFSAFSDEELEQIAAEDQGGGVLDTIAQAATSPTKLALRAGDAISRKLPFYDERSAFGRNALDTAFGGLTSEAAGVDAAFESIPRQITESLGIGEEGPGILDTYRSGRDEAQAELERLQKEQPGFSTTGTVAGVAAGLAGSGITTALRQAPKLFTPAGVRTALQTGKNLFTSLEPAKAALRGGAAGAGAATAGTLGFSDADLSRVLDGSDPSQLGEFAEDLGSWPNLAITAAGAALGGGAAALERTLGQQAAAARTAAGTASKLDEFDGLEAAYPGQVAEVDAANTAGKAKYVQDVEDVKAANVQGRQQYGERVSARELEVQAARQEAAARQAELEAEALAESRVPSEENAAAIFGLDDSVAARRFGGDPVRARTRSRELLEERLDDGDTRLVDEYMGREPEARVSWARERKGKAGGTLGAFREALPHVDDAWVPAPALKTSMRRALTELPEELQGPAIEKFYARIDKVANQKRVAPEHIRGMIDEVQKMIDAATDRVTRRALQGVRKVLTDREKALVDKHFPVEAPQYHEALKEWGVWSDVEFGASRQLKRAKPGQDPIRFGKPREVPRQQPREVPEAEPFQPQQPPQKFQAAATPEKPLYEGDYGAEADSITPAGSRAARWAVGKAAQIGGRVVSGGSRTVGEGARMGAQALYDRWVPRVRPTAAEAGANAEAAEAALQRWAPELERALERGPQAVKATHAMLMGRDPEYASVFAKSGGDERDGEPQQWNLERAKLESEERLQLERIRREDEREHTLERERMRLGITRTADSEPATPKSAKRRFGIARHEDGPLKGRLKSIELGDRRIRKNIIYDAEGRLVGIEEEDL